MSDYVTKTNVLSALARFKENTDALYETKADANEMKSEINQHDSRLQNLEQKAGDYSIVQYRGTNAVPTGKAKYGLVEKIVGKTRAWNQLVQNGNFADGTNYWTGGGGNASISTSGNIATVTASSFGDNYKYNNGITVFTVGHKYLLSVDCWTDTLNYVNGTSEDMIYFFYGASSNLSELRISQTNTWINKSIIVTCQTNEVNQIRLQITYANTTHKYKNVKLYDLTLIFGSGNEPSTVADALAQLPALGQYNAYDAGSLVSTTVEGVESVGPNLFPYNVVGAYNYSSDYKSYNANNAFKLKAGTYYALASSSATKYLQFFNAEHEQYVVADIVTYVSAGSGAWDGLAHAFYTTVTFTISRDCIVTVCVNNPSSDETLQVCLDSYADKNTYHPYVHDTLSLPEPVTLRGVGTCVETLDVETGVLDDGKFAITNLGGKTWDYFGEGQGNRFATSIGDIKSVSSWNAIGVLISSKYVQGIPRIDGSGGNMVYGINGTEIYIRDTNYTDATTFKNAMDGVYLLYEKATYTPSDPIDPVPDNTILIEGGGTIDTIQDQTPVIDNCLDVGYLAV